MMKPIRIVLGLLAPMALGGCVSQLLETNPPQPRYTFVSTEPVTTQGERVDWSLIIAPPKTTRAYDTTKLAVSQRPGRIEYFGSGEWAGRAPQVFQTALIESFENSGRILAVGDRTSMPVGDYELQTDIRRIELNVANGAREAHLDVFVRLTNRKGVVYAATRFSARAPAANLSGDAVADAFNNAFNEIIPALVQWTFDNGEAKASAES